MTDSNPAAEFDISDAGGTPVSRNRYLSDSEVRNLFSAMAASPSFTRSNELAVRLLLALCVRKMELLAAQWDAFDLDNGLWTRSETQTGTAIVMPLAEPVIGWLREVKVFSVGSDYLFPARRVTKKKRFGHVSPDTLNLALKQRPIDIDPFTVHDFRRTARTHLSALGVAPDIAERSLNHKIRGVRGVYDKYEYLPERRQALASGLSACASWEEANLETSKELGARSHHDDQLRPIELVTPVNDLIIASGPRNDRMSTVVPVAVSRQTSLSATFRALGLASPVRKLQLRIAGRR